MKVILDKICSSHATAKEKIISTNELVDLKLYSFHSLQKKENPKILFVAGWISQLISWGEVLREMVKDFDVYYLETREKKSSVIRQNVKFGVEEIGQDLKVVIEKLQLQDSDFILFGSSLGATAILHSHHEFPAKPVCNVLVAPNAMFRVPIAGMVMVRIAHPQIYMAVKPIVKWYLRTFRLDTESDSAQYQKYASALDSADPWKLRKAMIGISRYEVWDKLGNVTTPTLIVGGRKDLLHEPDNLRKIADMMPNASFIDMGTNTRTHSAEVVVELRNFLRNVRGSE